MQSDGRIRSKDIGTGEVNSRIVSDLYSDTYDGDKVDPEAQPGTSGWILLKNGLAVFNQAIIRGTITAAEIIGAIIRGGEVNIRGGGRLTVGGDPETGTPPLVRIDEGGVRVGPNVDLNESGLFIEGVQQPALDISTSFESSNSAGTLSSTYQVTNTSNVTVPSWAQVVHLIIFSVARLSAGATARTLFNAFTIDDPSAPSSSSSQSVPANSIGRVTRNHIQTITSFTSPIVVRQWVRIDAGTESSHAETLHTLAFFTR